MFAAGSPKLLPACIARPVPVRTIENAMEIATTIGTIIVIANLPFTEMSGNRATILQSDCLGMAIAQLYSSAKKSQARRELLRGASGFRGDPPRHELCKSSGKYPQLHS